MYKVLIISLIFFGCATQKYHDRDLSNPHYYEGMGIPIADNTEMTLQTKNTKLKESEHIDDHKTRAIVSLIEAGTTWALYPDYYDQSSLSGKCLLKQNKINSLPVQCQAGEAILLDSLDKELGRFTLNNRGQFAFWVEKDKSYFVKLRFFQEKKSQTKKWGPYKMGDKPIIYISE